LHVKSILMLRSRYPKHYGQFSTLHIVWISIICATLYAKICVTVTYVRMHTCVVSPLVSCCCVFLRISGHQLFKCSIVLQDKSTGLHGVKLVSLCVYRITYTIYHS